MNNSAMDSGIPVLTEILEAPPPLPVVSAAPAVSPSATPTAASTITPPAKPQERPAIVDVPLIDGWLNEEWKRLERKIGGRILQHVMESLEVEIKERIQEALADTLQVAVDALADDIKQNLQHSLGEVISQAVKDEISAMQTAKS